MKIHVFGLAGLITLQRLFELRLAARNRKRVLAIGAKEFGAGHYPLFFVLHLGWLVGWVIEAWRRGGHLGGWWPVWVGLFVAAQGLRYWCIASLGPSWNTRILIIPGAKAVKQGPYRFFKHPNYLAVATELATAPLIFGAWLTALTATVFNAALLLFIRIPAEEQALELLEQ